MFFSTSLLRKKIKSARRELMTTMTVEQRIVSKYNRSVSELLQDYASEGKTSKQVADILECGVSNVRRIARKYQIRFNQPTQQSQLLQNQLFLDERINKINVLSRPWGVVRGKTFRPESISGFKSEFRFEAREARKEYEFAE